jgi:hypothetical protein
MIFTSVQPRARVGDERIDQGLGLGFSHSVEVEFLADLDFVLGIWTACRHAGGDVAAGPPAQQPGEGVEHEGGERHGCEDPRHAGACYHAAREASGDAWLRTAHLRL